LSAVIDRRQSGSQRDADGQSRLDGHISSSEILILKKLFEIIGPS